MRICRKCSKEVSDNSKICRNCGGILVDIPDEESVAAPTEPEPLEPSTNDAQSVDAFVPDPGRLFSRRDPEASPWKCPQCSEMVPANFHICWKCQTTRDGEKPDNVSATCGFDRDTYESDEGLASTGFGDDRPSTHDDRMEQPTRQPPSLCPRCGSAKMMLGVTVCDLGESSGGILKVVIYGNPAALFFKDRLYGELTADICGDCGHVELRVRNPQELYEHYQTSQE
jgi:hypothetical protein